MMSRFLFFLFLYLKPVRSSQNNGYVQKIKADNVSYKNVPMNFVSSMLLFRSIGVQNL